ncbi:MAG: hypothetical protein WBB28_01630 [Crinalium sp.]
MIVNPPLPTQIPKTIENADGFRFFYSADRHAYVDCPINPVIVWPASDVCVRLQDFFGSPEYSDHGWMHYRCERFRVIEWMTGHEEQAA